MDIKEKTGDFLLDLAKLVFGGVILAGIVSEDINKIWLYVMGGIAFAACSGAAFWVYKFVNKED